ncbi:MAG: Gfo/Idh/MocA family oxidoreductase [bacterium]|nr:Gfo/Idh/MocA family oxidoreductase [bacterium]
MSFRIGVIGAGVHGARYLRHALHHVPGMGVAALCRRDEAAGQELATELDCRYHREAAALVADPAVDGVVVCTPPSSHFELAAQVLAAGKPLLLEKPMTGSLAEARRLAKLDAAGTAPNLLLAQTLRWNPVLRRVRELWPRLGRVHHLRLAQRLAPTTLAWQRDPDVTVGGSVLLTGVHLFDTARWLTGSEFVRVDSRQDQVLNPVVEDFFLARAALADGCRVSLEVSKYTRSRACWLEAVGEDAQLLADYQAGGIVWREGSAEERLAVDGAAPTLPLVLADWLAAVRDGSTPPVTVHDGVATMAVVDACYRSAAARAPVVVDG